MRITAVLLGFVAAIVGCSGASGETNATSPKRSAEMSTDTAGPAMTGTRKRLQGTWEIVRYRSALPVPNDAVPLMADLFDSLRVQFEPAQALVRTSMTGNEKMVYEPVEERGDNFRLQTNGGMFDGAACRFIGPDEWEVVDEGPVWPGISVLRRVNH